MPPSGSVENTSVDEACNSQENNTGGGAGTATKSPEKTRESPGSAATGGNGSSPQNADSSSNGTSMDPFPKKLRDTVHARLKSDGIMCIVIVVATTLLHWSGFFDKLQVCICTKCKHKWKSKNKTEHIDNLTSFRFRTKTFSHFYSQI